MDSDFPVCFEPSFTADAVVLTLVGRSHDQSRRFFWTELAVLWFLLTLGGSVALLAVDAPWFDIAVAPLISGPLLLGLQYLRRLDHVTEMWPGGGLLTRELRIDAHGLQVDGVGGTWQALHDVRRVQDRGGHPHVHLSFDEGARVLRLPISEHSKTDVDELLGQIEARWRAERVSEAEANRAEAALRGVRASGSLHGS